MFTSKRDRNYFYNKLILGLIYLISSAVMIFIIWLLYTIVNKGITHLDYNFLFGLPDEINAGGGIGPFIFNSLYVTFLSMIIDWTVIDLEQHYKAYLLTKHILWILPTLLKLLNI